MREHLPVNRKLARALRLRGATSDEIERAARDGWLALLTLDKLLMPGRVRYDLEEMAQRAGVEVDVGRRLWRSLGFPDLEADARVFTDADVRILRKLEARLHTAAFVTIEDPDSLTRLLEQTRMVSAALSRLAEVLTDQIVEIMEVTRAAGAPDEEIALGFVDELDWPTLARLTDYGLRLLTRASLWRRLASEDPGDQRAPQLAVGFVDLVGYTALSQELDPHELAALVERFEQLAYDTVAQHAGRVVKMIGDEVMYVADDLGDAARIALALTARSAVDELLPEARAGLAFGTALAREGDYYGAVVNLASRLVELARPGTVVVSDEVHAALAAGSAFAFKQLRSRRVRDIGRVEVWALETEAGERAPAG